MSIYWFSRAGPTASTRIYYEVVRSGEISESSLWQVTVPVGVSFFPKELGYSPRAFVFLCFFLINNQTLDLLCRFVRAESNVVFESEHDAGGHFSAFEQPETLLDVFGGMFG